MAVNNVWILLICVLIIATISFGISYQSQQDDEMRYNAVIEYRSITIQELEDTNAELTDSIHKLNSLLNNKRQKRK